MSVLEQDVVFVKINQLIIYYCPIKHPVCRGIMRGGEVNVCNQCLRYLNHRRHNAKQFIQNILYHDLINYLDKDVINTIGCLFEKLINQDHPRMFLEC